MKMIPQDYQRLKSACINVLLTHSLNPSAVASNLRRWEIFHRACDNTPRLLYDLYAYLNDNHIETALKRIFS